MRRTRPVAVVVVLLALAGCASGPQLATPLGGAVVVGLIGDTPYSQSDAAQLDGVIDDMNVAPLDFVVHVGDLGTGRAACGDAWLLARKRQFARIRQPFVLLPGDNEWTDCQGSGEDPLARLARWRQLFCVEVALPGFVRQPALEPRFGAYCENARWEAGRWVFVALNVPGSNNGIGAHPGLVAEQALRMQAVRAWLDAALAQAGRPGMRGLVILMHANPGFRGTALSPPVRYDGFDALRTRLAESVARLAKPVLLVHGDTHSFRDDEPQPGLRRIEVWGWPETRWVAVMLSPDGTIAVHE
jgi:hypothetical protein